MTPIFKRYFKKDIIFGVIVLLFILFWAKTDMSKAERNINDINNLVISQNIGAEFFDDEKNANFFVNYIEAEYDGYSRGIYLEGNEKNVLVPNLRNAANNVVSVNLSKMSALMFMAAIAFGVYAFLSERRKNTSSFVGSLPYKRERMFFEKWLAGFAVFAVIFAADYIFVGLWLHNTMPLISALDKRLLVRDYEIISGFGEESKNFGRMIWSLFLAVSMLYTFTVFAQNLFGKPVYAALTVAGTGVGFLVSVRAADTFCDNYDLNRISHAGITFFEKLEEIILNTPVFTLAAVIINVLLLAGGIFLCKRSRLENAGGAFMFRPAEYLVYAVIMCEGALVFYGFVTDGCGFSGGSLLTGMLYLALGAVMTRFALNKLFTLEVEI